MSSRPILALVSLVLIGGACLLTFFVLLAGAVNGNPVNQFYFLQADTSGIPNAASTSRWTLWNVVQVDGNGRNIIPPGSVTPAYPLDPPNNFGTTKNVPSDFSGTSRFYYMSRFMFAFFLMALIFMIGSFFLGMLALCSRIGSYLSSVLCAVALFFQTLTAALMTAAYVEARNAFNNNGQAASVGPQDFGFVWASWACLLIATVLFCVGGRTSSSSHRNEKNYGNTSRGGLFGGRNRRSRGSFLETESQRRVVDV